ncbi:dihydroneopterin aldolase [Stigmatella sp. ncwal1]|uniref:Dihydroneopterin aldolase n=1 Tax=Stigmatella ashevillensis TaxID=2995309 RepID=A0ABT5DK86_9BACT|nr:dihydroneopterin aldolase [Stigmatella ashevillena]MDC0713946.1 dihydroneopterin aldolase [Stigmatella ashevillena]
MSEFLSLPVVKDAHGSPLDVIELRNLAMDCIVGVYPRERIVAQPLRLDVALFLDTREAPGEGRLMHSVHWGRLAGELRFLLDACRFKVLESAAEAVARYVLLPPCADAPHVPVRAATVRVTKPNALAGHAVPSLQVHRTAEERVGQGDEFSPPGAVDLVHEGPGYSIYRLRIPPGGSVTHAVPPRVEQSELVLGGGLLQQGTPVVRGMAFHWPKGAARRYDNPTSTEQSLLCVSQPRFIPSGEEAGAPVPEGGLPVQAHAYYPSEAEGSAEGPSARR